MANKFQVGFDSLTVQEVINILKVGPFYATSAATAGVLDANGYPSTTFTGDIGGSFTSIGGSAPLPSVGPWVFRWPAGRSKFCLLVAANCTIDNAKTVGAPTISGGTGSNLTVTGPGNGTAGSITFTFSSSSIPSIYFRGNSGTQAYDAAGTGDWVLMLESNATRYDSGELFTKDFVDFYTNLGLPTLRFMNVVQLGASNSCSQVNWTDHNGLSNLSWTAQYIRPTGYAGSTSGTDIYTVNAWSDMASTTAWTADESFFANVASAASSALKITGTANNGSGLVRITMASTASLTTNQQVWIEDANGSVPVRGVWPVTVIDGTHIDLQGSTFSGSGTTSGNIGVHTITINGTTKGTKFLASVAGGPVGGAFDTMGTGPRHFHYDADMDRVIECSITSIVPIEAQVAICNRLGCDGWFIVPTFASSAYATGAATYIHNNLSITNKANVEYSNEFWNPSFYSTSYGTHKALFMGFNSGGFNSVYGLKIKQYLGNIFGPIFADRPGQLQRVLAVQNALGQNFAYRMAGTELGSYGFSSKPNRPQDCIDVLAYAPYALGANLCNVADGGVNPIPSDCASVLQAIVNAWDAGDTATAYALIDDDIRRGRIRVQTVTASGTTFSTPLAHNLAVNNYVSFQATGGTMYSGIQAMTSYIITSVPTSTTLTIQALVNGVPSGPNVNAGSAGTGTVTIGTDGPPGSSTGFPRNTMLIAGNVFHPYWQSVAAGLNADRPVSPDPTLRWTTNNAVTNWYEGAGELGGPDATNATNIGLTGTNPSASIIAAIAGFKNSPKGAELLRAYYAQFMGADRYFPVTYQKMPLANIPSNLNVFGGTIWSLTPDYVLLSTPYLLIKGVQNFAAGKRLMVW